VRGQEEEGEEEEEERNNGHRQSPLQGGGLHGHTTGVVVVGGALAPVRVSTSPVLTVSRGRGSGLIGGRVGLIGGGSGEVSTSQY